MSEKPYKYLIAVNGYRSSTDNGFAGSAAYYGTDDKKLQMRVLTEGLPVKDQCYISNDGSRTPCLSTMGVRSVTPAEVRKLERDDWRDVQSLSWHVGEDENR